MKTTIEEAQQEIKKRQQYVNSLGNRGKLEMMSMSARTFVENQIQQNRSYIAQAATAKIGEQTNTEPTDGR
jgi:hypothetical protein